MILTKFQNYWSEDDQPANQADSQSSRQPVSAPVSQPSLWLCSINKSRNSIKLPFQANFVKVIRQTWNSFKVCNEQSLKTNKVLQISIIGRQFRLDVVELSELRENLCLCFVPIPPLHHTKSDLAQLSVSISDQTEDQTSLTATDSPLIGEPVN